MRGRGAPRRRKDAALFVGRLGGVVKSSMGRREKKGEKLAIAGKTFFCKQGRGVDAPAEPLRGEEKEKDNTFIYWQERNKGEPWGKKEKKKKGGEPPAGGGKQFLLRNEPAEKGKKKGQVESFRKGGRGEAVITVIREKTHHQGGKRRWKRKVRHKKPYVSIGPRSLQRGKKKKEATYVPRGGQSVAQKMVLLKERGERHFKGGEKEERGSGQSKGKKKNTTSWAKDPKEKKKIFKLLKKKERGNIDGPAIDIQPVGGDGKKRKRKPQDRGGKNYPSSI